MANIVINTLNDVYQKTTGYRGVLGLGVPYDTADENSNYVVVPQESIETKLEAFKTLYNEISNLSGYQLNQIDNEYGEARDEVSIVWYTMSQIRDIIFKGGPVSKAATGNFSISPRPTVVKNPPPPDGAPGTWFLTYYDRSTEGSYRLAIGGESRFRSRDKCAGVLKDWIQLLEDILNNKEGLVIQEAVTPTTIELQDILESATTLNVAVSVGISAVELNLLQALTNAATNLTAYKALAFFDESREYKTVLNFGNDNQYLVEAWRVSPSTPNAIQLKLVSPLNPAIVTYDSAFLVTEQAKTVIDTSVEFELLQEADVTPSLRPFNIDALQDVENKQLVNNITLESLNVTSGSAGVVNAGKVSYEDLVFRRWLTSDFKSSELNINFTDFNNFVHYGSAYLRLITFANKLIKIENLNTEILASVSSSTAGASLKSIEKENIIRNFDPYEQFLYYTTSPVAYSASADYVEDGVEYFATGSWPKQSDGTVYSPTSGVITGSWLPTFGAIAQRYDEQNQNYLIKHLPKFIQEDVNSNDFMVFIGMFGHVMDNLKVYIDQLPNIYSKNPNPTDELTMDQVYEVATSFGLKLPNINSLQNLQSINQTSGSREIAAETWKRFLHSMIYLIKTKGSRTSVDALLNTYGISSPIVQIKETSYATTGNYVKSNELTYGLTFNSSSTNNIRIPLRSSPVVGTSVQVRFIPDAKQNSSIITSTGGWAVDIVRHPSASVTAYPIRYTVDGLLRTVDFSLSKAEYGRLQVVSGSNRTVIASSSYFRLFGEDYTNIMLNNQSNKLVIVQTDGDQILYQETASLNLSSLWNSSTYMYIGGSGSLSLNNFDGVVDEIRVWGDSISIDNFISQSYDPGSYYGSTYTSSYNNLYVHIPFSQPLSSITQSAYNESPYQSVSSVQNLPTNGFTTSSYYRLNRSVKQFVPIVGTTLYTNNKVHVVPPPTFDSRFVDQNNTKELQPRHSIKSVEDKKYSAGLNTVYTALSPTDFTNQNVMRTMGVVDVNNIIGSPRYIGQLGYESLRQLKNKYLEYYNKTVNPNAYTRFFKDLMEAISEMAETVVPARANLLDGIVIESSILDRNKTYLFNGITVSGYETKQFDLWVSSSSSLIPTTHSYTITSPIGAFTFDTTYDISTQRAITSEALPSSRYIWYNTFTGSVITPIPINDISGVVVYSSSVHMAPTTPLSSLPPFRRFLQKINDSTNRKLSFASSSIGDENSAIYYIEANPIKAIPMVEFVSGSGSIYPRSPYPGITGRLQGELNTTIPFFNISPRLDFTDVGTTTFFHKPNDIYSYDIFTLYKTPYRIKIETDNVPIDQILYAPITLLPTSSVGQQLINYPGRYTTTIPSTTYGNGTSTTGAITVSSLFTLYGITGGTNLRIRLYRNVTDLTNDAARNFNTAPTINSGVLFDAELNGSTDVFPYTTIQGDSSTIYYNINNTSGGPITSAITLNHFRYDISLTGLVPSGYLPRHYKFNRDNNTAMKRRNYLGCKISSRKFDKSSPITITISNANTLTTIDNMVTEIADNVIPSNIETITFGGGGTLDVT